MVMLPFRNRVAPPVVFERQPAAGAPVIRTMPNPVHGTLSNTYRSDRMFTPLAPARGTTSKFLYTSTGSGLPRAHGQKWGRGDDYGLHINTSEFANIKGHRHFSTAFEYIPGDVPQNIVYNMTSLKRDPTRPHDHLVVEPQKTNIQESQISLPFPKQHTYFSHLSHKDLFPQHKPPTKRAAVHPDQVDDAADSDGEYDVEPVLAFSREFKPDLRSSTKGNAWRSEKLNSDWRPAPVQRPQDQLVSAETFNKHKQYAKSLKETHYSRTHGQAIKGSQPPKSTNLNEYKPSWKHDILKSFNEAHNEPLPDIRTSREKKHVFYGVHTMAIEHG